MMDQNSKGKLTKAATSSGEKLALIARLESSLPNALFLENLKKPTDMLLRRKEDKIVKMSDKEIMDILKEQSLPTFGTKAERENRLRKAWGIFFCNA